MSWRDGYIAVDWGTTNRRAYLVDKAGTVTEEFEDDCGLMAVAGRGGFDAAAAEITTRLGDRPMLLAGMVGSNRGWREAAYVPCPAGGSDLAANICWIEPGRIGIVPGVSQSGAAGADVMRGEEIQVLGAAAAGLVPPDCLICHPGTHAKWIVMAGGRIRSFRTMMTGELFSLLSKHSILADRLRADAEPDHAFRAAARQALAGAELVASLFGIRARFLLGEDREDASAVASGLLIGSDVRAGLATAEATGPIVLMGRPELVELYAAALNEAGRETVEVDGADAFLAGARMITEML
jgi:2-dehydro-3-deoxygalactonokinase